VDIVVIIDCNLCLLAIPSIGSTRFRGRKGVFSPRKTTISASIYRIPAAGTTDVSTIEISVLTTLEVGGKSTALTIQRCTGDLG
jgi:hypothetical protein